MPPLTRIQARNLVDRYFHTEGWYPPGTNPSAWAELKLGELGIDDPPLDGDPDVQKKRIALDLQQLFFILGSRLASPIAELGRTHGTLGDFADWCADHQID